jgi:serine/threonine-protein kinase CHEK1
MNTDLAHKYFCQLIQGVEYLHSKGIVHRDVKPENLLLNDNDVLKIADFGLATLFQYKGQERLLTSPSGTTPYVAPEVLVSSEYKATPTDLWSCGIVLVAMLAGELPWDKPVLDCNDFLCWIKDTSYQRSPWYKLEMDCLSLLKNILKYEPRARFNIQQIKTSTWFIKYNYYFLLKILNDDSN